jgi:hypothetical protein
MFQWNTPAARPPEALIPRLCRESGRWLVIGQQADLYRVRANDHKPIVEIDIRCPGGGPAVLFQAWFPVRFRLDNPPSGLFARLLLRNIDRGFAKWSMVIGQSCEACLTISGLVPLRALVASLLDCVCGEIRDEILGFQAELHEKFSYFVPPPAQGTPAYGTAGAVTEIEYAEPAMPAPPALLPAEEAWRMIQETGPRRYRLPGPRE